jgi:hypothetical protein
LGKPDNGRTGADLAGKITDEVEAPKELVGAINDVGRFTPP